MFWLYGGNIPASLGCEEATHSFSPRHALIDAHLTLLALHFIEFDVVFTDHFGAKTWTPLL